MLLLLNVRIPAVLTDINIMYKYSPRPHPFVSVVSLLHGDRWCFRCYTVMGGVFSVTL